MVAIPSIQTDISIIIPLYKGQKYCERLLKMIEKNCLYNNLFRECQIEVIFVNDYPDEQVLLEDNDSFFDIKLIIHKENMGIQASRRDGITYSKGQYIIMLDQDDFIKENYLYSQWKKITSENSSYCICNGWSSRFRVLLKEEYIGNRVNSLDYYLDSGNAIISPGQVIFKREDLPQVWLDNILMYNGADDFLLWIIILKKGYRFLFNNEYLYYHNPQRSFDSIDSIAMIQSLRETVKILSYINLLDDNEIKRLNQQIERKEYLSKESEIDKLNIDDRIPNKNYIKFQKMFFVTLDWLKIKIQGIEIFSFFKKNSYFNIAIYGMGYIGECLYYELQGSGINIKYAIDRIAVDFEQELTIVRIEDQLQEVDAIVLTILENDKKIIDILKEKVTYPIITVSEIFLTLNNNVE